MKHEIITWIVNNRKKWDIIRGNAGADDRELKAVFLQVVEKVRRNGDFEILLITMLKNYGDRLFPDEEIDIPRYCVELRNGVAVKLPDLP